MTTTLDLYPNPARDLVWAVSTRPLREAVPLRVLTLSGREVLRTQWPAGADRVLLPVGALARGVYVVQVAGVARKLTLY